MNCEVSFSIHLKGLLTSVILLLPLSVFSQPNSSINEVSYESSINALSNFSIILIVSLSLALIISIIFLIKSKAHQKRLKSEISELRLKINALKHYKPEEAGVTKTTLNKALNNPLSDREFEILNLALSNHTNSEIAEQLYISVNTVKFHLKNIYLKLKVSGRKEALNFAILFGR